MNIDQVVIATHNRGKLKEYQDLLKTFSFSLSCAGDHHVSEPEETGKTFDDNAILKAKHCFSKTGLPSLADDSGLVVPVLNGDPGIYSARWAETPDGKRDFGYAMNKLEEKLKGHHNPEAYFICVICLYFSEENYHLFEGRVYGHLEFPPRGQNGFGYDPIFVHKGDTRTFGEMSSEEKYAIAHRSMALDKCIEFLNFHE